MSLLLPIFLQLYPFELTRAQVQIVHYLVITPQYEQVFFLVLFNTGKHYMLCSRRSLKNIKKTKKRWLIKLSKV